MRSERFGVGECDVVVSMIQLPGRLSVHSIIGWRGLSIRRTLYNLIVARDVACRT